MMPPDAIVALPDTVSATLPKHSIVPPEEMRSDDRVSVSPSEIEHVD